jgi:hypothetical protein
MSVLVQSPTGLLQEGLVLLLERHGYKVQPVMGNEVKVVLSDLVAAELPYPEPSSLPTVALIGSDARKAQTLLAQGYTACVDATQPSEYLAEVIALALESTRLSANVQSKKPYPLKTI